MAVVCLAMLVLASCSDDRAKTASKKNAEKATATTRGVEPSLFECDDLLQLAELSEILGGGKVEVAETAFEPPRGVARPCAYTRTATVPSAADGQPAEQSEEPWSYDLDCRPNAVENGDKLIEQYRTAASDRKKASDQAPVEKSSEGKKKGAKKGTQPGDDPDEVAPARPAAPITEATDVDIGRRGLDHNGQSLIFIDDDAPCYVRVNGPRADGRASLARALSEKLTPSNAPTGRRYDN